MHTHAYTRTPIITTIWQVIFISNMNVVNYTFWIWPHKSLLSHIPVFQGDSVTSPPEVGSVPSIIESEQSPRTVLLYLINKEWWEWSYVTSDIKSPQEPLGGNVSKPEPSSTSNTISWRKIPPHKRKPGPSTHSLALRLSGPQLTAVRWGSCTKLPSGSPASVPEPKNPPQRIVRWLFFSTTKFLCDLLHRIR